MDMPPCTEWGGGWGVIEAEASWGRSRSRRFAGDQDEQKIRHDRGDGGKRDRLKGTGIVRAIDDGRLSPQ